MRLPAAFQPYLFALLLSGLMSLIVSGIATLRATGIDAFTLGLWLTSWLSSWLIAFPSVLVVAPLTRRLVARLVEPARAVSPETSAVSPEKAAVSPEKGATA